MMKKEGYKVIGITLKLYDDGKEANLHKEALTEALQLFATQKPSKKRGMATAEEEAGPSVVSTPSGEHHDPLAEAIEEGEECGVCYCDMYPDRDTPQALIRLGSCGHVFHTECLRSCSARWRNVCPLCKTHYSVRRELPPKPRGRCGDG